jgi:hypothetical protein
MLYDIVAQYEMLTLASPFPSDVLPLDWLTLKQVRPQQRACSEASSALPNTKLGLGLSECNVRFFGVCAAVRKSHAKLGALLLRERPREVSLATLSRRSCANGAAWRRPA